jgi:predicted amidohydrolase
MRLLLTAVHCAKGDIAANLTRHLELLSVGAEAECDLVLLPEMSLTGYHPPAAITLEHASVRELVEATRPGPDLCFGLVERGHLHQPPHITQAVASRGQLAVVHRKAGLAEDEVQTFLPGAPSPLFSLSGVSASLAVCAEIGTQPPYRDGPALVLAPAAPGLYGPRRASEADWQRGFDWWRGSVLADAARLLPPRSWLAVSTQAGATVDEDFPGWAALVGPRGVFVELPDWHEGTLVVDLP